MLNLAAYEGQHSTCTHFDNAGEYGHDGQQVLDRAYFFDHRFSNLGFALFRHSGKRD
jgi:hypothetical protein